jgi:chromosome segregation ATPase
LQTLAQDSFQKVGLDFKRGVSKFATKKEHLSREDYIKQQKQKQLKSLFVDIDTQKKELKNIYTEINKQKNEMKKQRDLYKKGDLEYKEYKDLENSIKDKKIEVENVENYEKSLKNDIAKIVKEHTKKETPLLSNTFYKVEDRNIMFTKLVNKIQEPLNIQLNEITHLKRENQSLKNENSKMLQKDLQNQKLIQNLELKQIKDKQKIEKQTKKINKLQNQTLILISFFKSLGLKINDFKKYFKSQKQQQKSYEIER